MNTNYITTEKIAAFLIGRRDEVSEVHQASNQDSTLPEDDMLQSSAGIFNEKKMLTKWKDKNLQIRFLDQLHDNKNIQFECKDENGVWIRLPYNRSDKKNTFVLKQLPNLEIVKIRAVNNGYIEQSVASDDQIISIINPWFRQPQIDALVASQQSSLKFPSEKLPLTFSNSIELEFEDAGDMWLDIGTHKEGSDISNTAVSGTHFKLDAIPDVDRIFVTLWTKVEESWQPNNYDFAIAS